MRIGSLFSGAAGLDRAVAEVFGGDVIWFSEIDKAASKVLAHRFPGVPNLGSITEIDWAAVPAVDVLCGGYPCQPFSHAGQREGVNDERHLWPYFAEAIRRIRPRYAVLENVAGHRSMGFDSVLADLAEMRYDAQWCSVRASDVGAPHQRERLFVLATGADQVRPEGGGLPDGMGATLSQLGGGESPLRRNAPLTDLTDLPDLLPTPTTQDAANCAGPSQFERNTLPLNAEVTLLPTPEAKNSHAGPDYARMNREGSGGHDLVTALTLLCTPSAADGAGGHLNRSGDRQHEQLLPGQAREMATAWGKYAPAIARWEHVLGRPAPPPTEPNKNGNPRLSAAFSEWLMGWPEGWVTDPAIGISRNDQLRIVGNGVVSLQASAALRWLLAVAQ